MSDVATEPDRTDPETMPEAPKVEEDPEAATPTGGQPVTDG